MADKSDGNNGATKPGSAWHELQDRLRFATSDNEQKYETNLVGGRALYTQLLTYPSTIIQNAILRPDLAKAKKAAGKSSMFNGAAAYNFADKWLLQGVGGQVIRSVSTGYAKHENYTTARDAADALVELAAGIDGKDGKPSFAAELAQGKQTVLQDLFTHSQEAGEMLEKFISGKLDVSPSNLTKMNTLFAGLAEMSHQRAEMLKAYDSLMQKPAGERERKPADYIREVVSKPKIETVRDAQVFLGFTASLLADSALPFSSELYIPQEEVFLTPDQNKALAQGITERLGELQKDGAVASPEKVIAFANELHYKLTTAKGTDINRLLDFADARFFDIENNIAHQKAAKDARTQIAPEIAAAEKEHIASQAPQNLEVKSGARDAARLVKSEAKFLTRSHMGKEINKLYGRGLSNQIMAFPVNVLEEVLRNFFHTSQEGKPKAGFDAMVDRLKGKDTQSVKLFDTGAFKNNLLANGYRMVMQPIIAAQGTVILQEGSRLKSALAVEASKQTSPLIAAAIRSGQDAVPEVAERLEQTGGQHPAIAALLEHPDYKSRIAPLLAQGGKAEMGAEDYKLLGDFFLDMSRATVSMAEEVLSPFQSTDAKAPQKVQSIDEVAERILKQPITNVPDAMIGLAFAESFTRLSRDKIEMIEYIDPEGIMIKPDALKQLSYFIEDESKRRGLALTGEKGQERLTENGQPASKEAIVGFGNAVVAKLDKCISLPMLLGSMKGELRDEVVAGMENQLFGDTHFDTTAANSAASGEAPKQNAQVDKTLTTAWAEKVKRPKESSIANVGTRWKHPEVAHERQKLYDRLGGSKLVGAVSTVIYKSLQHNTKKLDRGNLVVAAWTYAAHPILYGKGIVQIRETWDEMLFHKQSTLNDANKAVDFSVAAVKAAGIADPNLNERLSAFTADNLALDTLQKEGDFRDIARLAAKPRAERTEQDNAAMESYYQKSGDTLLQVAGGMLSSLNGGTKRETFGEAVERVTQSPVDNLPDAVIALSFLSSLIHQNAAYLDKMTYTDPKDIALDRKALEKLGGFMSDQAYAAGF
ncbi:MAG: hypothetical protein FJX23_03660, partial [Alphaproteobacteria bacterium]|nr:hypothetical protein [Alphaproteobacteria bacterium]